MEWLMTDHIGGRGLRIEDDNHDLLMWGMILSILKMGGGIEYEGLRVLDDV